MDCPCGINPWGSSQPPTFLTAPTAPTAQAFHGVNSACGLPLHTCQNSATQPCWKRLQSHFCVRINLQKHKGRWEGSAHTGLQHKQASPCTWKTSPSNHPLRTDLLDLVTALKRFNPWQPQLWNSCCCPGKEQTGHPWPPIRSLFPIQVKAQHHHWQLPEQTTAPDC